MFHLFFPQKIHTEFTKNDKEVGFYEWLIKIISNAKGIINVRNAIYFIKILFEKQYDELVNMDFSQVAFCDNRYNIFNEKNIKAALHKIQENMINDYADLVEIKNKNKLKISVVRNSPQIGSEFQKAEKRS